MESIEKWRAQLRRRHALCLQLRRKSQAVGQPLGSRHLDEQVPSPDAALAGASTALTTCALVVTRREAHLGG